MQNEVWLSEYVLMDAALVSSAESEVTWLTVVLRPHVSVKG